MRSLLTRTIASVGAAALLALGSTSASALSTWDFTGDGGFLGHSEVFIANDGSPITANAFTQILAEEPDPGNITIPNHIHQTGDGIGVGILGEDGGGAIDAIPPAYACLFLCAHIPAVGLDVIRLEVGGDGWLPVSITISQFDEPETVWFLAGSEADGSDAVLLNELNSDDGNPDPEVFGLDDSNPFNFFFVAAVAEIEPCPKFGLGKGFCGEPSHLRLAGFTGEAIVSEPGTLALFGIGLGFLAMRRRRNKAA